MSSLRRFLLLCFALLFPAFSLCAADVEVVRFAMIVGSNYGNADAEDLLYATTDARAVSTVLTQLGGVSDERQLVLQNPSVRVLEQGFSYMDTLIREQQEIGRRLEMLFYFSGHSSDDGLLLYEDIFYFDELKKRLEEIPTDVKIVILDACFSGAYIRPKGGNIKPPFLWGTPGNVEGSAVLTSSMSGETSQESDHIQASFFTHALISGLRGGADINGDGLVSLNEIYDFTFNRTIVSTEKSEGNVQHPGYQLNLTGQGNFVLTDVRATNAVVVLKEEIDGRVMVKDLLDRLIVEVVKNRGVPLEIGLEPGRYDIAVTADGEIYEAAVTLRKDETVVLSPSEFLGITPIPTTVRGGEAPPAPTVDQDLIAGAEPSDLDPGATPVRYNPLRNFFTRILGATGQAFAADVNSTSRFLVALASAEARNASTGVVLAPYFTRMHDDFSGVQSALGANIVDGEGAGLQISPGVNLNRRSFRGVQLALLTNIIQTGGSGVQIAPGVNFVNTDYAGLQVSLASNFTLSRFVGPQLTVGINAAHEAINGLQFALFGVNYAGGVSGAQLAFVANVASREMSFLQLSPGLNVAAGPSRGIQLAMVSNYARRIDGVQIAGLNMSGAMRGAQIGLINYATEATGVQIGVINISQRMNGLPLGIIDIQLDGQNHFDLWADAIVGNSLPSSDAGFFNMSFRFGGKYFYKHLTFGMRNPVTDYQLYPAASLGLGLGARLPLLDFPNGGGIALLGDISANYYSVTDVLDLDYDWYDNFVPAGRLFVDLSIFKHIGLFLGIHTKGYIKWGNDGQMPTNVDGGWQTTILADLGSDTGRLDLISNLFLGLHF